MRTGTEIRKRLGTQHGVHSLRYSSDGRALFSVSEFEITVRRWDVEAGKELAFWAEPQVSHESLSQGVESLALAPDGKVLASAHQDGTIRLWEAALGNEARVLAGHRGTVLATAFSPDGKMLASVGHDSTIIIWNVFGRARPASKDVEKQWSDLGTSDSARAFRAMDDLASEPKAFVAWLPERLPKRPACRRRNAWPA